jgi:hypothetical protein
MSFPIRVAAVSALMIALAPAARAQDQAVLQKMIELNRQALTAFAAKDFEGAKSALMDAVVMGKEAGLTNDKMMARTYVHLGVVYVDGFKDRAKGIRYLALALRIRPDIPMTPSLVTPTVTSAFEEARKDPQAVGMAPAPKTPAPPKPVAAPVPAPAPRPAPPPVVKAPPPPEPEPAPAPEPEAEARDDEPDLPANLPTPLYCPNPDEAPPGEPIALRCVAAPTLAVSKVLLFYRLPGGETFSQVSTDRSRRGWYNGVIPSDAAAGKSLQYYFEARDASGKEVATNGRNDSPNLMLIREGAPIVGRGALAGLRFASGERHGDEENPLEAQQSARERAIEDVGRRTRRAKSFFVGFGVGTGYGYHGPGRLEYRTDLKVDKGLASVGLLYFSPEAGYMITDGLSVSLQGRFQYIPEQGTAQPGTGSPAHGANSILAKLAYAFGHKNLQVQVSVSGGGGEGFRLQVPPKGTTLPRNDTVRVGPIVFGPGVGLLYNFIPRFAWALEARSLIGQQAGTTTPSWGYTVDISTGPQVSF